MNRREFLKTSAVLSLMAGHELFVRPTLESRAVDISQHLGYMIKDLLPHVASHPGSDLFFNEHIETFRQKLLEIGWFKIPAWSSTLTPQETYWLAQSLESKEAPEFLKQLSVGSTVSLTTSHKLDYHSRDLHHRSFPIGEAPNPPSKVSVVERHNATITEQEHPHEQILWERFPLGTISRESNWTQLSFSRSGLKILNTGGYDIRAAETVEGCQVKEELSFGFSQSEPSITYDMRLVGFSVFPGVFTRATQSSSLFAHLDQASKKVIVARGGSGAFAMNLGTLQPEATGVVRDVLQNARGVFLSLAPRVFAPLAEYQSHQIVNEFMKFMPDADRQPREHTQIVF